MVARVNEEIDCVESLFHTRSVQRVGEGVNRPCATQREVATGEGVLHVLDIAFKSHYDPIYSGSDLILWNILTMKVFCGIVSNENSCVWR